MSVASPMPPDAAPAIPAIQSKLWRQATPLGDDLTVGFTASDPNIYLYIYIYTYIYICMYIYIYITLLLRNHLYLYVFIYIYYNYIYTYCALMHLNPSATQPRF